jgi:hypothetical protein
MFQFLSCTFSSSRHICTGPSVYLQAPFIIPFLGLQHNFLSRNGAFISHQQISVAKVNTATRKTVTTQNTAVFGKTHGRQDTLIGNMTFNIRSDRMCEQNNVTFRAVIV